MKGIARGKFSLNRFYPSLSNLSAYTSSSWCTYSTMPRPVRQKQDANQLTFSQRRFAISSNRTPKSLSSPLYL